MQRLPWKVKIFIAEWNQTELIHLVVPITKTQMGD